MGFRTLSRGQTSRLRGLFDLYEKPEEAVNVRYSRVQQLASLIVCPNLESFGANQARTMSRAMSLPSSALTRFITTRGKIADQITRAIGLSDQEAQEHIIHATI